MTGISETTVETESVLDDKTYDKFKILFNNTSDGIYLFDKNGRFVDYNKAAEMICGYVKHELIGQTLFESGLLFEINFQLYQKFFLKIM
jgi:PAS domain S-box-containing protein